MKSFFAAAIMMATCAGAYAHETCATTSSESISIDDHMIAEAVSIGDECANAIVVAIVRDGEGAPIYTFASPVSGLFGFYDISTERQMADALDEFVGVTSMADPMTSSDLPEWVEGLDNPDANTEFPFYPVEWMTREDYELLRTKDVPVWCHVQGMESMKCVAFDEDYNYEVGVQTFPG